MYKNIKDFLKRFRAIRIFETYGQHLLEYTLIMTLVVAAVITMGPYVIRAWNANLKGWEDSAEVSYNDPLVEALDEIELPYCTCGAWVEVGCGGGTCLGTQMHYVRPCNPAGCSNPEKCEYNDSCCIYYDPMGCGPTASPPCPDGQIRITEECGDNGSHSICRSDPSCVFLCIGPLSGYQYGDICLGDDMGLPNNLPWTTVDDGACTDALKCEQQCVCPFEASPSGAICVCPDTYYDNGSTCVCNFAEGYIEQGSVCSGDDCEQGACGDGQCSDDAVDWGC